MGIPVSSVFEFVAPHVNDAGTCDEKLFLRALNQALDLIWPMGDWEGTIVRCVLPMDGDCCVALPHQIESIRNAWAGKKGIDVHDPYYENLQTSDIPQCGSCGCEQCSAIINLGIKRPVAVPIQFPASIAIQFGDGEKDGSVVTVNYTNTNGSHKIFRATYVTGGQQRFVLPEQVTSISMVGKQETVYPVLLLADTGTGFTTAAFYHPKQVNPTYNIVRVVGLSKCCSVIVRAKLRRQKITSMDDELPIENAAALAFAVRAVSALGRDANLYGIQLKSALDLLRIDILDDVQTGPHEIYLQVDQVHNLMPG